MIAEGKMKPAGMKLYTYARENGLLPSMDAKRKKTPAFPEAPEFFTRALQENPEAERAFSLLAPSYKLQYLGWIMDAKKEETRLRRMKEALERLTTGKKLGMK